MVRIKTPPLVISIRSSVSLTKVEQIRETGRAAAGVRLINLDEGETLVSLERVAEEAEDEAALESDATENQVVEAEDTPSQES